MPRNGGVSFDGGTTYAQLGGLDNKVRRAMFAAAGRTAPQAEAWMKTNARWIDHSSNARNGLGARALGNSNRIAVVLYHSVPYGIWLEVRWDGRYAIIEPAIAEFGPKLMAMVQRLAFGKGS